MVKKHEKSGKGELSCKGKISDRASQHARIDYKITIKYGTDSQRISKEKGEKGNS